jgi:amino acid adenylation domain-containing protein
MPADDSRRTASTNREHSSADPSTPSIVSRIASYAMAMPDHAAVGDGTLQLTFAGLERRSDHLAARLRNLGAGPEGCVGLFLERSAEFVVSALAVLKTGAAYLPLDPSTPRARAEFILADAGASLLVTHREKTCDWRPASWRVIALDGPDADMATHPVSSASHTTKPDDLAYIVYTSGSTGRPKGVEITHANLAHLIAWHQAAFRVDSADRASQVAGLGFDATAWEIWPHLTAGASLHIADEATRRSPHALRDWLIAERITISFVPTVLAESLLSMTWPAETALRVLLTGADTLHRRPAHGLPFDFVNNYGPTECTVVATSGKVSPDRAASSPPSIGRPIASTRVLILDDMQRPVAPGQVGELCLAGPGVGRGYRNNPGLTAGRFVSYASESGPPLRIYRTGDRARLLDNGELAFHGRLDDQVKIRGFRIELGEIIACLDLHPSVEASAVVVGEENKGNQGTEGGRILVAYVVAARNARPTSEDLRNFVAARLPDYMIPTCYVAMTSLPITANGKLDKGALPAPSEDNLLRSGGTDPAPGASKNTSLDSSLEERIAALVASLLGQPSVEPEDNFFMAGGHSMLGVQLLSRLRDTFGVKLTLRQLFNAPTVVALSAEVAGLSRIAGR